MGRGIGCCHHQPLPGTFILLGRLGQGLINVADAGQIIAAGPAAGWTYLTTAQAATPFSLSVIFFALFMLPGAWIHDRRGPKAGPVTGGVFLAAGCFITGLSKSYGGLILGFGILSGIGLGLAYASTTPAALRWFGSRQRGLVAGLVLSGYGAGVFFVPPLTAYLVKAGGMSSSFIYLGVFFALVIIPAGTFLAWPDPGYAPPVAPVKPGAAPVKMAGPAVDWAPGRMLKTWQFWALAFMFGGALHAGRIIIAHAGPVLAKTGKEIRFLVASAWILSYFGGLVDIGGRIGTGKYSDILGRNNALSLNCLVTALCLFSLPVIIAFQNLFLLLLVVGIAYWIHGGTLALTPAYAADFYGTKNLGMNYILVSMGGWPLSFFLNRLSGPIRDWTGSLTLVFILSAVLLTIVAVLSRVTRAPVAAEE